MEGPARLSRPVQTSTPTDSSTRDRIRIFDADRAEGSPETPLYDFTRDGHHRPRWSQPVTPHSSHITGSMLHGERRANHGGGIHLRRNLSPRACAGLVIGAILVMSVIVGMAVSDNDNGDRPVSKAAQIVTTDGETRRGEAREHTPHANKTGQPHDRQPEPQGKNPALAGGHSGHESASPPIMVAVICNVTTPGLVSLPPHARVDDAINAAGGLSERGRWDGLNRAQKVLDGQQICVGEEGKAGTIIGGEPPVSGGAAHGSSSTGHRTDGASAGNAAGAGPEARPGGRTNINTASETELTSIPGVGPKTASAIIAYREQNGPFHSIDQLAEVKGIGPAKLATMRDAITM